MGVCQSHQAVPGSDMQLSLGKDHICPALSTECWPAEGLEIGFAMSVRHTADTLEKV